MLSLVSFVKIKAEASICQLLKALLCVLVRVEFEKKEKRYHNVCDIQFCSSFDIFIQVWNFDKLQAILRE